MKKIVLFFIIIFLNSCQYDIRERKYLIVYKDHQEINAQETSPDNNVSYITCSTTEYYDIIYRGMKLSILNFQGEGCLGLYVGILRYYAQRRH